MKQISKKAVGAVVLSVALVATLLSLPTLWMIGEQNGRIGQVTYLPDYTTVALGEQAAANPVARSLYEHKQTYLIQGDEQTWDELDPATVLPSLYQELEGLGAAGPNLQRIVEEMLGTQVLNEPDYIYDTGTYLGFDNIQIQSTVATQYSHEYWVFSYAYDPGTEKIMTLHLEQGTEGTDEIAELMDTQMEDVVATMGEEYREYLGLEGNSFQEVDLGNRPQQNEAEDIVAYNVYAIYSSQYQVYLFASVGRSYSGSINLNLGAASLTPEELEKCL